MTILIYVLIVLIDDSNDSAESSVFYFTKVGCPTSALHYAAVTSALEHVLPKKITVFVNELCDGLMPPEFTRITQVRA